MAKQYAVGDASGLSPIVTPACAMFFCNRALACFRPQLASRHPAATLVRYFSSSLHQARVGEGGAGGATLCSLVLLPDNADFRLICELFTPSQTHPQVSHIVYLRAAHAVGNVQHHRLRDALERALRSRSTQDRLVH